MIGFIGAMIIAMIISVIILLLTNIGNVYVESIIVILLISCSVAISAVYVHQSAADFCDSIDSKMTDWNYGSKATECNGTVYKYTCINDNSTNKWGEKNINLKCNWKKI